MGVRSLLLKFERTIQRWRDEQSHFLIVRAVYGIRSMFFSIMRTICFEQIVLQVKNAGPVGDLSDLFRIASRGWYGIIAPIQARDEFLSLLRTISDPAPIGILEIGTASGGTLFMFTRIASESAKIASVDLPGGSFGGGYPESKTPLYDAFALPGQQLKLFRADSHAVETFNQVKAYFGEQPVDFIFIDGDHTYEGVRKDFEMYKPLIRNGGYIAFHDIVYAEGVSRFWLEIQKQYSTKWEFISENNPQYGIGILQINHDT